MGDSSTHLFHDSRVRRAVHRVRMVKLILALVLAVLVATVLIRLW